MNHFFVYIIFLAAVVNVQMINGLINSNYRSKLLPRTNLKSESFPRDGVEASTPRSVRRRRSKSSSSSPNKNVNVDTFASTEIIAIESKSSSITNEALKIEKSKLAPLSGSTSDIQQKFAEKNAVQRYLDELSQPGEPGKEPKSVQFIKAITWFSIIALVVVEIVVSIKSGSSPPTTAPSTPFPSLQELSYPGQ